MELQVDSEILPGVRWGHPTWVPSPAYWHALAQADKVGRFDDFKSPPATPLNDQLAFCLLGGYGIKMEVNQAAWNALKQDQLLDRGRCPSAIEIEDVLRNRVNLYGRHIVYRFHKQKSVRLAEALRSVENSPPPTEDVSKFREYMMNIAGIGPKTASWLARNWLGSEQVAILDIHVVRACQIIGLFTENVTLPKMYFEMEQRFLEFAEAIAVRPALLDAIIWTQMRRLGRAAFNSSMSRS